jgi:hypothetical protein
MFEATSQVRARIMQWLKGKPSRGSKSPSRLVSVDSAIWSAKEAGTPTPTIDEKVSGFMICLFASQPSDAYPGSIAISFSYRCVLYEAR